MEGDREICVATSQVVEAMRLPPHQDISVLRERIMADLEFCGWLGVMPLAPRVNDIRVSCVP